MGLRPRAIRLLNEAVATEMVCILRYRFHAITATGIASESVKAEFDQHASEEEQHLVWIADASTRPVANPPGPRGRLERSASQYVEGADLVEMIRENLIAERIAVETYRDMIRYFAEKDPTTGVILESVLAQEEEHANDMHDLGPKAACVEHGRAPVLRDGVFAEVRPQQRARDGAVGVGVAASVDDVHERRIKRRRVQELPESRAGRPP